MTIGMSTGCYHGLDIVTEVALDEIAGLGVTSVEVFIQGEAELHDEVLASIGQRVRAGPLDVVSLHPYPFGWEHLLFGPYTRQREWARSLFHRYLRVGVDIGASAYVSHGPPVHLVRRDDGTLDAGYVETMRRLVAEAGEQGMRFCLENVSYGLLRTPADAREHQRLIPGLGFVVDVKSAWKAGVRPADFGDNDLLGAIHHTQVSFRLDGRYGLPAPSSEAARADPDLLEVLALPVPHILEIEATTAGDARRSVAALRVMEPM